MKFARNYLDLHPDEDNTVALGNGERRSAHDARADIHQAMKKFAQRRVRTLQRQDERSTFEVFRGEVKEGDDALPQSHILHTLSINVQRARLAGELKHDTRESKRPVFIFVDVQIQLR